MNQAGKSTLRCKLDSQLPGTAVRSIFWVGGKWIMEIPDKSTRRTSICATCWR